MYCTIHNTTVTQYTHVKLKGALNSRSIHEDRYRVTKKSQYFKLMFVLAEKITQFPQSYGICEA